MSVSVKKLFGDLQKWKLWLEHRGTFVGADGTTFKTPKARNAADLAAVCSLMLRSEDAAIKFLKLLISKFESELPFKDYGWTHAHVVLGETLFECLKGPRTEIHDNISKVIQKKVSMSASRALRQDWATDFVLKL